MIDLPKDVAENLKTQNQVLFSELIEKNEYGIVEGDIKGRNILDVGANVGFFSIIAAHLGARMVVSIEPNRENFSKLVLNTKGFEQIHPLRFALGSGVVSACETTGSDVICETHLNPLGTTPVISLAQAASLFPLSDDNLTLKIDAEGAEFDTIYYAGGLSLRRFSTVFIEVHLREKVKKLNFHLTGAQTLNDFMEFIGFKKVLSHTMCWWEYKEDGTIASCTPCLEVAKYELQK
jgi:FkbM family methyltransferase